MTLPLNLARGPVMLDVAGLTLEPDERQRLLHPQVGGVILFRRNFESVAQVRALCAEIHALRTPALLLAVDHEGGRVQRFLAGFTRLPPRVEEDDRNVPARARLIAPVLWALGGQSLPEPCILLGGSRGSCGLKAAAFDFYLYVGIGREVEIPGRRVVTSPV